MAESRDYLEMTYASINCFADDGTLNAAELKKLLDIALRDGELDDNEMRVLHSIIKRLRPEELDEEMRGMLEAVNIKLPVES